MRSFKGVDYYEIEGLFSEEERMIRDVARAFTDEQILPITLTPLRAGAHRATYPHDTATTPLAVIRDADAVHCFPRGSAPAPSPVAAALLALGTAPSFLH